MASDDLARLRAMVEANASLPAGAPFVTFRMSLAESAAVASYAWPSASRSSTMHAHSPGSASDRRHLPTISATASNSGATSRSAALRAKVPR